MTEAIAYLRVSTEGQSTDGFGLEIQLAQIEAWASQQDPPVTIINTYTDAASGTLADRPGLIEALADPTPVIVVAKLDRLARDAVLQELLLRQIRAQGRTLTSTSPAEAHNLVDDETDPSRKLIRQIIAAVAEFERDTIKLRTAAGRARKAARGGYSGGAPNYGYMAQGGELVPNPATHPIVERIYALRDQTEPLTYQQIADLFNAEQIPSPKQGRWHATTVSRVLQSRKRIPGLGS